VLSDEATTALITLTGLVLGQQDLSSTLDEVARVAVRAVGPAVGASVSSYVDGRPAAVAFSDDWAKNLDELQYEEHEGPCLDCARTGNVFRIRDLADEPRWPNYAPRAVAQGARSMLSMPMASEGKIVGALNTYARIPDAFSAEDASVAELVAAHAGLAVQVATAYFGHRDLAEQTRQAMASRSTIEQAKGIVMAERRCTPDEAFEILVELSQTTNRKLRDVAAALVARTVSAP
jgi:GAF domain-containing protein